MWTVLLPCLSQARTCGNYVKHSMNIHCLSEAVFTAPREVSDGTDGTVGGKQWYRLHFTDTEAERGSATCPGLPWCQVLALGLSPVGLTPALTGPDTALRGGGGDKGGATRGGWSW